MEEKRQIKAFALWMKGNNIVPHTSDTWIFANLNTQSVFVFTSFNMLYEYFELCEKNPGFTLEGIIEAKNDTIGNIN